MTGRFRLRRAAWLARDLLIAACTATSEAQPGEMRTRAAARLVADGHEPIMVARLPTGSLDRRPHELVLEAGEAHVFASSVEAREALTDLKTFVRDHLAGRDSEARARLQAALVEAAADYGLSAELAESLHALREALRERCALAVAEEPARVPLGVEGLHRIDDNGFYLRGWFHAASAGTPAISAVSPEGERVELLSRTSFARPLDDQHGFVCYFRTRAPSRRQDGWIVEAQDAGDSVEVASSITATDRGRVLRAIVADATAEGPSADAVRESHVRPALTRIQEIRRESVGIDAVETHGAVPRDPAVSLVVPLFERIDLVEHQLVQFAGDTELHECEVIYVLDSPDQADELEHFARQLHRLYDLPFRTAVLNGNGGVPLARNLGASLATGRHLLFLDSDVLPARTGWVGDLSRLLDARPRAGAVAPKLLHEDESVQHAGMTIEPVAGVREWSIEHRMKGLHTSLPAVNASARVPAVTGACLMIDRALFGRLGGMSWTYVQGDYEDADLCLRLAQEDLDSLYAPEVSLFHLEGQSYPPETRAVNRRYNRWLFSRAWDATLEELSRNA